MKIEAGKLYVTRDGREVRVQAIVEKNSVGQFVTFPVKGSWYYPNSKSRTLHFDIWRCDGRNSIFCEHALDIVGEKHND